MLSMSSVEGRINDVKKQLSEVIQRRDKTKTELQEQEKQILILQGAIAGLESLSDLEVDTSEQQEPEEAQE